MTDKTERIDATKEETNQAMDRLSTCYAIAIATGNEECIKKFSIIIQQESFNDEQLEEIERMLNIDPRNGKNSL